MVVLFKHKLLIIKGCRNTKSNKIDNINEIIVDIDTSPINIITEKIFITVCILPMPVNFMSFCLRLKITNPIVHIVKNMAIKKEIPSLAC